jgi:hypothetical protein
MEAGELRLYDRILHQDPVTPRGTLQTLNPKLYDRILHQDPVTPRGTLQTLNPKP